MNRSVIGIALGQAIVVGLVTFFLIVAVEYVWAGQLIDVRLYALASAAVTFLVFLFSLKSTCQRRNASGPGG